MSNGGSAANLIDRWWNIDSSVNPLSGAGADISISYRASENTLPNPTSNIRIQHYDDVLNKWDNPYPFVVTAVNSGIGTATASGLTKFSPHVLIDDEHVLPVEWLSFTAKTIQNGTLLEWKVLEKDNDFFEIQRSEDGQNFRSIGKIKSQNLGNYQFVDTEKIAQTVYYRIKQVDLDTKFSFSKIIAIKNGFLEQTQSKPILFPNPNSDNEINISWKNVDQKTTVLILNVLGNPFFEGEFLPKNGNLSEKIRLDLPKGIYQIILSNSQKREVLRLVKQ